MLFLFSDTVRSTQEAVRGRRSYGRRAPLGRARAWAFLAGLLGVLFFGAAGPVYGQDTGGVVTGTVIDSTTGNSLPGVNVYLLGTQRGTTTDAEGSYTIAGVEPGAYDVQASYIGYGESVVRDVQVEAGETVEVNFNLREGAVQADEVVVIGYGTTERSSLTGAVTSIDEAEMTDLPSSNVLASLQGEVPGMDITRESGETGSGFDINIRGNRSLTASNSPLVIVDGTGGSLENLNPNDIASIEVLKDAAATAIYGSRGANGVILVTTKKGVSGETQVTINSSVGATTPAGYPESNTAEEYVELRREAHRTEGGWSSPEDDPNIFSDTELENIRNGVSTNFRDLLLQNGLQQDHQVGVSTGSENTQAYLSLSLHDEQGIVEMDQLRRYGLRLNLSHQISDLVEVGANTQFNYADQDQRTNPLNMANKIPPIVNAYDEEGNLITRPGGGAYLNPLIDELPNHYANETRSANLNPTFFVELDPTDNLLFRSDLNVGADYSRQGIFRASESIDRDGAAPEARYITSNSRSYDWQSVLTYDNAFGNHELTATGVFDIAGSRSDFGSELGRGQLLASQLYYGLGNAPEGVAVESGYVESSSISYAGRLNYGWNDRYLLTLSGRYDGASQLSEGNKWAFFPAAAAAWRIVEEGFMEDVSLFSDLKLRLSYGVTGNDAVDPYATQATLRRIPFAFGEEPAPGYTYSDQAGNDNLEWERSTTANIGLDVGLWSNRVYATVDVYNTRTTNLLLQRFLPQSSGLSSVIQNVGETQNRGIELGLRSRNIVTEDFFWESDFTFFSNSEEILELTGEGDDIANGWFIGAPTEVFFDYEKIGIWQEDEAEEAASFGQEPGQIKVKDQNGDGVITPEDRTILGSPRPDWSGSLENTFNYKNFDLSALLYARRGSMMQYDYYGNFKPQGVENGSDVDYWTPENPTNAFPRPTSRFSDENYQYFSSLTYENASFVKLRSITLGYTLPQSIASGLFLDNVRIYFTGRNLLILSEVDNYDPERGGGLSFPMTRAFTGGIDIGF